MLENLSQQVVCSAHDVREGLFPPFSQNAAGKLLSEAGRPVAVHPSNKVTGRSKHMRVPTKAERVAHHGVRAAVHQLYERVLLPGVIHGWIHKPELNLTAFRSRKSVRLHSAKIQLG